MFKSKKRIERSAEALTLPKGYRVTPAGHIEVDLGLLSKHPGKEKKLAELERFSRTLFGDARQRSGGADDSRE